MVTDTTIKKSFKQTELGVIPVDWDVISYGEAFDFLSTASYSRAELSDNDEVFYIHYGDIHTTWNYFLDFKKYTLPTIEKIKVKNYSFIKDGDLIMADTSEDYDGIGKSVEVKNITTKKAISGLHTFLLRGKKGIFVNGFKGYIHSNRLVKTSMDRLATGLKVYGVSKTSLKTIQIPRPTLPEQSAIATVLSNTDALIERLEKLIAKKKAIKQGAMQQLLTGKKRLPGFSGKWEVKKLGDVAPLQRGFDLPTSQLIRGPFPVVYSNGILNFHHRAMVKAPGVVTGRSGTIGKVNYIEKDYWPHNTTLWVTDFRGNDEKYVYFLYSHIKIEQFRTGSGVPTLNRNDVHDFLVSIPKSQSEQTAIAAILSDMDAEIESLEQKRDKYTMLKQGMMQELLTGRTRLI